MKTNHLVLACAIASAFALSACHHDDDDTASPSMVTTPGPAPNAESTPAPTSAMPPASSTVPASASGGPLSFEQMDKNHDGFLTPDELQSDDLLRRNFDHADTDHDGKLSKSEAESYRAANAGTATDVASPG